ncbi:hypothetical protein M0813_16770 [Anaeramoeba flamelloides]|uniref:Uncharacterized protein n=1 Tax=Anaeramoeba flamelloides TaxID=1746091 RepID=A0ABQ8YYI0_9EUKA|nr:hypothetical protein M0813_16770 [Anaeramoeba flamelloides]
MGNSANSHNIKKRHYKKYIKRLEDSKLPVAVLNGEGKIVDFTSTFLKEVGWVGKDHLFRNHKPGRISAKIQNHYKCDTQTAIKMGVGEVMKSSDGLLTRPWNGVDQFGTPVPLWIYCTLISVGDKPHIQTIWKKRTVMENSELEEPVEIDSSILKVKISDDASVTSHNVSNLSEGTLEIKQEKQPKKDKKPKRDKVIKNKKSKKDKKLKKDKKPKKDKKSKSLSGRGRTTISRTETKENTESEYSQTLIVDDFEEQNKIDQIIESMKNKSRGLDQIKYEMDLINDLNSLVKVIENIKLIRDEHIGKLTSKLRNQNSKNKKKISDLEKLYQKKYTNYEKTNEDKMKIINENRKLKQIISKLYSHIKHNHEEEDKLFVDLEKEKILGLNKN